MSLMRQGGASQEGLESAESALASWRDDKLKEFVTRSYKLAVLAHGRGAVQRAAALLEQAFQGQ